MIELFIFKNTFFELIRAKRLVVWFLVIGVFFVFGQLYTMSRTGELPGVRRIDRIQQRVENRIQNRANRQVGNPAPVAPPNESVAQQTEAKPKTKEEEKREAYSVLSAWLVFRLLALVAAIFAAVVVAQEIEQKTIVYLLTRPVPREKILLARTAAAITVTLIVAAIAAVAVSVSVMGFKNGLMNDLLMRDLKALVFGAAAYVTLFVLISLFINRSMLVCLLFAFGWETAIPNMPGSMYKLSIFTYLTAISERPSSGGQLNTVGSGLSGELSTNVVLPTTAYITLAVLIVGGLMLGSWWFRRSEYVPREDAE